MAQVRRIVAITAEPELKAAASRLGALVGATVEVRNDGIRDGWRSADALIVGADLARAVAASDPGRRPGVVVLASGPGDEALWRAAVALGAIGLFTLPGEEQDVVEILAGALEPPPVTCSVVAVVGGCGGAGASTLAAGLAVTSAASRPTVLVDGDRLGGGLDMLLGIETVPGLRWPELASTRGRLPSESLAERLPSAAGCAVLSWDRGAGDELSPDAAAAVIDAATRAFTRVVLDLPRAGDPGTATLVAAADRVVVVTTASVRAIAATASTLADLARRTAQVNLAVRDPGGGGLSAREVERVIGVPVTVSINSETAVAVAAERGEVPLARRRGSLARACRILLAADVSAAA